MNTNKAKKMNNSISLKTTDQKKFTKNVKKVKEKVKSGKIAIKKKPGKIKREKGVIYVGHLPHGFYEKELLQFFKQFGDVTNVTVRRSELTGKSKGYGFVEFKHPGVAKVAAETMNNYLMFKRILKVQYVPVHKRSKVLFTEKRITPNYLPLKIIREHEIRKRNKYVKKHSREVECKTNLNRISKKLKQIKELTGVDYDFKPVDVPENFKVTVMSEKPKVGKEVKNEENEVPKEEKFAVATGQLRPSLCGKTVEEYKKLRRSSIKGRL